MLNTWSTEKKKWGRKHHTINREYTRDKSTHRRKKQETCVMKLNKFIWIIDRIFCFCRLLANAQFSNSKYTRSLVAINNWIKLMKYRGFSHSSPVSFSAVKSKQIQQQAMRRVLGIYNRFSIINSSSLL